MEEEPRTHSQRPRNGLVDEPHQHITPVNGYNKLSQGSALQGLYPAYPVETNNNLSAAVSNGRKSSAMSGLQPEYLKLTLSYIYMSSASLCAAYAVVISDARVPDVDKYPPLPDIALDVLPFIPWGFEMCEIILLALCLILIIVFTFHKHRTVIMRRWFTIAGTVFLIRCMTMLMTSLSVTGYHTHCKPTPCGSFRNMTSRALSIWKGMGMSLQGVQSCGDYMFSGHTVMVTITNFFITQYTPRRMCMLHTATWLMNLFSIFFILAGHAHYSIDVFVAFYIAYLLCLYYHALTTNLILGATPSTATRCWFPFFYYWEAYTYSVVPCEFHNPFCWPRFLRRTSRFRVKGDTILHYCDAEKDPMMAIS